MKTLFLCTLFTTALTLAFSALVGDNRYGAPHSGNSLNHRSIGGYSSGPHSRGPAPQNFAHRAPLLQAPAYGGVRNYGASPSHYSAPAAPSQYLGPSNFGAPNSYGARVPSHYNNSPKRSVYQPQQHGLNNNYQPQHGSYQQQSAQSKSQTQGREMKYTINDPHNKGTTHVTETHIVSNRQMHGQEAEAAMKKLMGNMGPGPNYGSDGGFQDFVKDMGIPLY